MNRAIKFRAWNKEADRWSKPFGLKSSVLNYTDDDGLGVMKSLTNEVVVQFTGLKDKNDTPIYEGDIVDIHTSNGVDRTVVEYYLMGFYFRDFDNQANIRPLDHYKREVIGNIYENPELMEQSK